MELGEQSRSLGPAMPQKSPPQKPINQETPPHISQVALGRAALDVIDAKGIDALSVASLAQELRCRRDDIARFATEATDFIDLACDAIYREVELDAADRSWSDQLRASARSYRRALLRHPRCAPFISVRPIVHDAGLRVAEAALLRLTGVGFSPAEANRVILVIVGFVNGHALTEIGGRPSPEQSDPTEVDRKRQALPPEQLPILSQVFAIENDRDAEFELGIDLIVGGLERHLLHA